MLLDLKRKSLYHQHVGCGTTSGEASKPASSSLFLAVRKKIYFASWLFGTPISPESFLKSSASQ
jgi:hypothetical protein